MYYEGLFEELRKGKISPLYLFYGEEQYLKNKALEEIKNKFFKDTAEKKLNFHIFYGKDFNFQDFFEEASTFPALSGKKLLVIKDADKLKASSRDKISKVLAAFPEFSHLIFFFQKLDKRQKLFKSIEKTGHCINFYLFKERELNLWIIEQFKQRAKEIDPEAVSFLTDRAGNQLENLEKEIEKISLYAGRRAKIEPDDLKAANRCQTQNIYELTEKIIKKETQPGLKLLSNLMRTIKGTELIGLFYWQYTRLWKAKILKENEISPQQIGRKLGVPNYYLTDFLNTAAGFSKGELKENFRSLLKADMNLKLTKLPPKLTLELLLIELCGVRPH